jgi:hypothetical protein
MTNGISTQPTVRIRNLAFAVILLWFLFALAGSLLGVFNSQSGPPIPLGLAAAIPIAVFALGYLASTALRQFVLSLDLRLLTAVQTWRIGGIVFVILYLHGLLPGRFALPAGLGDMAVGAAAPFVAWFWRPPFPRKTFITWNVLGTLDLVAAVTLGVLCSAAPIGLLAGDVTTRLIGLFPLSLVPTFFVPLLLILHIVSFIRIRKQAY